MNVRIFKIRLDEAFLEKDQKALDQFLKNNDVIKFESAFVTEKESYWSVILYYLKKEKSAEEVSEPKAEKYSANDVEELNSDESKILESLKIWRSEKAREQRLPSYFIATNKELISVAKFRPLKKEELKEIKGFGKHKIENYGEEIISIIDRV